MYATTVCESPIMIIMIMHDNPSPNTPDREQLSDQLSS